MPNNFFKPKGPQKFSEPDAGGAVLRNLPVFGVVKDNIDPTRSGRLRVYINDLGGPDSNDSSTWVTVSYMTPFYGVTTGELPKTGYGTYLQSPAAYGMWTSPPDLGSTVVCIFINGDPDYGFWIGCVPKPEALYTVPAIGASEEVVLNAGEANSYGGATRLPVANINSNNQKINENGLFFNQPKPVHSYLAGVLNQQGLIRDPIRGPINSSAQRETPSRVGFGISTPGRPIYEGGFTDESIASAVKNPEQQSKLKIVSRRGGHSFVMDDGDLIGRDQLVRLRSSLGHQLLFSDDGQTIFLIHANGQSWVELGKEGTIDMYATNSVNIRTQGDLNFHADRNINMHAKKDFNLYGENLSINTDKKTNLRVGNDFSTSVQGKTTLKSVGAMSFKSSGEAGFASTNATYINGSKVNLNTGQCSLEPAEVKPIQLVAHTDTLYDSEKGWNAAPGFLLSITSRAPAHAPWANANQGTDAKVNNDAAAALPSNPNPAVATANSNSSTPETPVTPSVAATVPPSTAVSAAIDKNTTAAIVAQTATIAQTIPNVAEAIKTGAGVVTQTVDGITSTVAVVGAMAQTPKMMEVAGVIKPGAAQLVDNLVQAGKTVEQAMTTNLFTGVPGAENLTAYVNNAAAQVTAQVTNLQQAQTQLTQAGLITGKESPAQLAGVVTTAAIAGVNATIDAVKSTAGAITGAITTATAQVTGAVNQLVGAANTVLGSATSLLNAGNFAGNMATTITGGLNSIAGSLNGLAKGLGASAASLLDSAKGIAGSAFNAIKNSLPKLEAGVPQNLKKIADDAIAKAQAVGTSLQTAVQTVTSLGNTTGANAASIASGLSSAATNVAAGANAAIGAVTASVATLNTAISTGLANATSSTQFVSSLSQTANAINSSVVNVLSNTTTATQFVSGVSNVASTVNTAVTAGLANVKAAADSISGTLSSSAVSSGLGVLPGAQSAVSSVVNSTTAALNAIPGTGQITTALNQISASIGSGGELGNVATDLLGKLKSSGESLQALASTGLPPAAAAQLNSAINALNSSSAIPIKMPTVAANTVDRTAITAQISSVFGSTKIPIPNYSGNPASTGTSVGTIAFNTNTETLNKIGELQQKVNTLVDERFDLVKAQRNAAQAYTEAKNTLPAGDPGISSAEASAKAAAAAVSALDAKVEELRKQISVLATS